ncbi:hypothetical protein [Arthrobacter sp. H20]|uniref:hypothetical protein n=1 Tax=Arthrobacter sp. H20 TaxID=1267981 RepID=UPI00047BEFE0|nr:hypothetical protein [Arthrobacter sp. H20]
MSHTTASERTAQSKQPTHSGEGHLASNLITFIIMMALFLGSIFSLTFFVQGNVWAFAVCLVLFFLAYWIPQGILGRSDTGPTLAAGDRKA